MSATGNSAGVAHSCKKFFLIRARVFARKFNLDIQGATVRNAVAHNVALAVVSHVYERAVLRIELADCMVSSDETVLAESRNNLVL